MFNPLSLRLCCLATMAPALTSEAATRTRDKLPGPPTPPVAQVSLLNGRDCQMNTTSKGGGETGPNLASSTAKPSQLVSLAQGIHRKLAGSGHIPVVSDFEPSEPKKGSQISIINLGSIANISELYRHSSIDVLGQTSVLNSQQLNQLISTVSPSSMASKTPTTCTTPTCTSTNGIGSTTGAPSGAIQTKMALTDPTSSLEPSKPAANKPKMISESRVNRVFQSGPSSNSNVQPPTSHNASELTTPRTNELSNGFHSLSRKSLKSDTGLTSNSQSTSGSSTAGSHPVEQTTLADQKKTSTSKSNEHSTKQMLENVARRQRQLETKTGRLLRQLRRLQSRQAISHTKQQLSGLVEHEQQALQCSGRSRSNNMDLKTELMQRQNAKNMSTAALVSLIQKWQTTQTTNLRHQLASTSQEPVLTTKLEEETCVELDRVSGHLRCNLAHLQRGLDSDATESSSGGESCDEWDYEDDWDDDGSVSRPPLQCRAEWKWANDRAAVAARWTWLQAQVSDLEYRIRQQYDIYKQIRANKGSVCLGDPVMPSDDILRGGKNDKTTLKKLSPLEEKIANLQAKNEMSPSNVSTLLSNVDKQSSRMSQQMGPLYTPLPSPSTSVSSGSCAPTPKTPNGFVDSKSMCTPPEDISGPSYKRTTGIEPGSPAPDHTCQAARCRPVRSYRKRKLLRTAGLHNVNRKAARLSTVQCHCFPPMTPCAMCGGRYNNTVNMEAETMPCMEKNALVDLSFHPVLSFSQDVGLSTHFVSMLKTGEWQKPHPRTYKVLHSDTKRAKLKDGARKYPRKLKKSQSATVLSSAKIRNKYEQKQLGRGSGNLPGSPIKVPSGGECTKLSRADIRLRSRKNALAASLRQRGTDGGFNKDGTSPGAPPSFKDIWLRKKRERERGESAYDINNIVIPYSIAASTRVEKLQYKEILTPKWREITDEKSQCDVKLERSESREATQAIETPEVEQPPKPETAIEIPAPETTTVTESKPTPSAESEDEPIEDLSDEIFMTRHVACEISEKKRFSIPASASALRRSRGAQRTDSMASTTNIEPTSPIEATTGEGSLVSQLATPPGTPATVPNPNIVTSTPMGVDSEEAHRRDSSASAADMRARSCSVSSSKSVRSRSASYSEERPREFPAVTPWPPRHFPLLSDDCLLDERPAALIPVQKQEPAKVITEEMTVAADGRPTSPVPGTDSGSEVIEEDPDDPEWTVISERAVSAKQQNLVLKLSKR